jgi:hypothetical protein
MCIAHFSLYLSSRYLPLQSFLLYFPLINTEVLILLIFLFIPSFHPSLYYHLSRLPIWYPIWHSPQPPALLHLPLFSCTHILIPRTLPHHPPLSSPPLPPLSVLPLLTPLSVIPPLHPPLSPSLPPTPHLYSSLPSSNPFFISPCPLSDHSDPSNAILPFPPLTPRASRSPSLSFSSLQRVFNDLKMVRLSRRRMIWLHPLPPLSSNKPGRRHTGRTKKSYNLLTGGGGKGMGEEPNRTTARKLVLYKLFNTLCVSLSYFLLTFT